MKVLRAFTVGINHSVNHSVNHWVDKQPRNPIIKPRMQLLDNNSLAMRVHGIGCSPNLLHIPLILKESTLKLVGVVTYYGKHYSTFFLHGRLKFWIYFDDATVKEIGCWQVREIDIIALLPRLDFDFDFDF